MRKLTGRERWGFLPCFSYGDLAKERWLVARLDRIEPLPSRGRYSFEFDGIDAAVSPDDVDEALSDREIVRPFALVRVITSFDRFASDLGSEPREGMWVEMQITPEARGSRPRASLAQLTPAGYTEEARGHLGEIRVLFDRDEPPRDFPGAGASVAASRQLATSIVQKCSIPSGAAVDRGEVTRLLRPPLSRAHAIKVRDVGQASFTTIFSADGKELAHFDAGWPISYNGHTAPPVLPSPRAAPVILSHWDWDHLHAWHRVERLRLTHWLVPQQQVGPGATKVANALHAKRLLRAYAGADVAVGASTLIRCKGPSGMNDTGLALSLALTSGKVALLVGDASYAHLGMGAGSAAYDMMVATHHGATFVGPVPVPKAPKSPCVVSVGYDNIYGHPTKAAVDEHRAAGWKISRTCTHRKIQRGDRTLS
jgi:competence protein ComEC